VKTGQTAEVQQRLNSISVATAAATEIEFNLCCTLAVRLVFATSYDSVHSGRVVVLNGSTSRVVLVILVDR
jgi:hypothetical protein